MDPDDASAALRCLAPLATATDPDELIETLLPRLAAWTGSEMAWAATQTPEGGLRITAALDPDLIGRAVAYPGVAYPGGVVDHTDADAAPSAYARHVVIHTGCAAHLPVLVCASRLPATAPDHVPVAIATFQPLLEEAFARATEHARLRTGLAGRIRAEAEAMRRQTAAVHQHKMDAVAQLAAGMAHEINSPLQFASDNLRFLAGAVQALSGATTTLLERMGGSVEIDRLREEGDLDFLVAEAPRAADQCKEAIERIAAIVETLKRFGVDNQGPAAPADLNQAIGHTVRICAGMLPENIVVRQVLGELPPVTCRIAEIRQILVAIIRNAVQAIADRGGMGGTIIISTLAGPDSVQIAIEDDGCGMDADTAARACEPFFTTRPVGSGAGQGLAIADDVIRRHGGRLDVVSEPGSGTRIGLILPISGPRETMG